MKKARILNALFWFYLLLSLIREVIEVCLGNYTIASVLSYVLLLIAVVAIFFYTPKERRMANIFVFLVIPLVFVFSAIIFPDTSEYVYGNLLLIITGRVPALLLILNVTQWDDFFEKMRRFSLPYFLLGIVYLIVFILGRYTEDATNYMRMAYNVLIPVCIVGVIGLTDRRLLYNILFWVSLIAIFLAGCRAVIAVGICVYGATLLILRKGKRTKWLIAGILVVGVVVATNFESVESFIISRDSDSRISKKMEKGILFQSEGRELIRTVTMAEVKAKNYMPQGFFADRDITRRLLGGESYVHNIVLEFIVDFGLVGGILLFGALIFFFLNTARKAELQPKIILCMFATYSIVKLMFSNSYIEEMSFYIFIGALFAVKRSCNNTKIIKA